MENLLLLPASYILILSGWNEILSLDSIMAISALFVSIVAIASAICFNIKTLKLTKDHYRRTVKPILYIWRESFPQYFFFSIKNGGTGPAIIKNVIFKLNDESYPTMDKILIANKKQIKLENIDHSKTTILFVENLALLPNADITIFKYYFLNQDGRNEFIQLLTKISFTVYFKDVYGVSDTLIEYPINGVESPYL